MKKLIFALLCLLVAVATYSNACVLVNRGDHWELNGTCTETERDVMIKEAIRSDSTIPIITNYTLRPQQKKSDFYKVIGEDIRLRKDRITGWKIERGFIEDTTKAKQCEFIHQTTLCAYPSKEVYKVRAEYLKEWYTLYIGKDKQDAINWLDRNVP